MGNTNGAKYKHMLYNLNRVKSKSGKKYKKAKNWYILILRKQEKQGDTKWIYKTKLKAKERLKKYGISDQMIISLLEKKGLKDLVKYV